MKILNSRLTRWLITLILVGLVIFLADWNEVWQTLRSVESKWVLFAAALVAADRLTTILRWAILLWAADVRVGFAKLLRIQLAANFLGSFLPSSIGVDALRIAALRAAKQPTSQVIAATLIDRISLAVSTLLIGALMLLIFAHSVVPPEVSELVLVGAAASALIGAICLLKPVRVWVRLNILPLVPARFQRILHETADASLAYRHQYAAMVQVTLLTFLIFAIRIWFVQTMALAVGVELHFLQLAVIIPILWLIMMLPISVGGVGLQDASYVALLAFLGLPHAVALSISLMEHVLSRLVMLPGLLFVHELTGAKRGAAPLWRGRKTPLSDPGETANAP